MVMALGTLQLPNDPVRQLHAIVLYLFTVPLWATEPPVARFTENKGQWPPQVAYRALVPGGAMYVEHDAFTYLLHTGGPLAHREHAHDGDHGPLKAHAFRVRFEGAQRAIPEGTERLAHYENYFLGNDPARWGTRCGIFGQVRMKALYPGIDLHVDGTNGLKYELEVAAGADPGQVRMRFEGQDRLHLEQGRLVVETTCGKVIEEAPVAWQQTSLGRIPVRCQFALDGDRLRFHLPDGYDQSLPLVIDPVLSFGSYSGSAADNFGFTATYDNEGHLYGGGIVFGSGYPTTLGVQDPSFNGGIIDIGITKFSPDGGALVWSTYIGGSGNETPHSLVVNTSNELYLLGSTGSADFPATPGAHDASFNGGTAVGIGQPWYGMLGGYGYGHDSGTDIVVAHFTADATALVASTFVGGSGNDGINNVATLVHNYGDHFRGEIALDPLEYPVVATTTQSLDMPISANAPQSTFGGGTQDAFIFRLDPLLATLSATYFGGSGNDSGYGVQFDSNGQVFVTGGTTSNNLSLPGQPYQGSYSGNGDGYVLRLSADLGQSLSATYVGTPQYDQSYFVQIDLDDDVYVVGQTHGAYPVSSGVYGNPGSSQFIHKLDNALGASSWSTVIGSGLGDEDIAPSAFLVSDCGQIYFSGWGGMVNHYVAADNSTTVGLPVTADAYQPATDNSDFYLMVLAEDAAALNYATFFGGSNSNEHVDGGTSRFDKHGTVYQAVCAGCGGNNDFPTTPGAWSNTNNSFNCNMGVFKFALLQPTAHIEVDGPSFACLPGATVTFINLSQGGTLFDWDFGDGTGTTEFEPTHTYTSPGQYTVRLVLSDEDVCTSNDTAYLDITVILPEPATIDPVPVLCVGGSLQLQAHGGHVYQWLPADGITNLTVADPVVQPGTTTTYTVIVTDSCGTDTASIEVVVAEPIGVGAGEDATVCLGGTVQLTATGGATYSWTPGTSLDDPASATPTASPADTTLYHVLITTDQGCEVEDSVLVIVQYNAPVPLANDTVICKGDAAQLHVQGGDTYAWQPMAGITDLQVPDPVVAPLAPTTYTVLVGNACGTTSTTVFVDVLSVLAEAWPDTTVCPGEPLVLHASGGTVFQWAPVVSTADSLELDPAAAGSYWAVVQNDLGCADTASVNVALFPPASVSAGFEGTVDWGDSVQIHAYGSGTFLWSPDSTLSCADCPEPFASPLSTTIYTVEITDGNGCKATDQVTVYFRGSIFLPNTFTPNGDGVNDRFFALAHEVTEYRLLVFNRWGGQVFATDRLEGAWDGTFHGMDSPIDTYVWRVDYTTANGSAHTAFGHVNLIR